MTVTFRKYRPDTDFLRVRALLVDTHETLGRFCNWGIERWNYARYFVMPMMGAYGLEEPSVEASREAIRLWEELIGVWENDDGEIVGAVTTEYPKRGDVFFQRRPGYKDLPGRMLDHAEENLTDEETALRIHIGDRDEPLRALALERGYAEDSRHPEHDSTFVIAGQPEPRLPKGFALRSMSEENDIELRREIFGRAFNHTDPAEWPSAFAYEELQRAPDYRKDLDLFVVGPGGQYVACCIVWHDERNRLGILEPVGTHPDFRRRGLGRAVVTEGIRKAAVLGAKTVRVGSGQAFYEAIGFRIEHVGHPWTRRF